jgi:hypothetical protein
MLLFPLKLTSKPSRFHCESSNFTSNQKRIGDYCSQKLMTLTLRLIKFKTENKELISYLLFDDFDQAGYISDIKYEVTESLSNLKNFISISGKKSPQKSTQIDNEVFEVYGLKRCRSRVIDSFL